jgi:uncharacterized DUF497 family protein
MKIAYDPAKNTWNIRERGLSFDGVAALDWSTAIVRRDTRRDYGEEIPGLGRRVRWQPLRRRFRDA